MNPSRPSSCAAALLAALGTAVAGCASQPDQLQAEYVSPIQFQDYDCEQIRLELVRIARRVDELHGTLKKTADDDAAQMAVGLVLFWPALLFLEGGDVPQAAEYSRLKGEYQALESAAVQKRCNTSKQAPAIVSSTAAPASAAPAPGPASTPAAQDATLRVALAPIVSIGGQGSQTRCSDDPERDFRAAAESLGNVDVVDVTPPVADEQMLALWRQQGVDYRPDVARVSESRVFSAADAVLLVATGQTGGWYCIRATYELYLVHRATQDVIRGTADSTNVRREMARMLRLLDRA